MSKLNINNLINITVFLRFFIQLYLSTIGVYRLLYAFCYLITAKKHGSLYSRELHMILYSTVNILFFLSHIHIAYNIL